MATAELHVWFDEERREMRDRNMVDSLQKSRTDSDENIEKVGLVRETRQLEDASHAVCVRSIQSTMNLSFIILLKLVTEKCLLKDATLQGTILLPFIYLFTYLLRSLQLRTNIAS